MKCIVVYEIEKFGEVADLSWASRLTRNYKILISSNEKRNRKLKIPDVYADWEWVKGFSTTNRYSITIVVLKKKKKKERKKKGCESNPNRLAKRIRTQTKFEQDQSDFLLFTASHLTTAFSNDSSNNFCNARQLSSTLRVTSNCFYSRFVVGKLKRQKEKKKGIFNTNFARRTCLCNFDIPNGLKT